LTGYQEGLRLGRPIGSRTAFSAGFLKDLAEVWFEEDRETMVKTARTNPAVFFATCARLIPNDVRVTVEQGLPAGLSLDDRATLREVLSAVREGLPGADQMPPGQVFQQMLGR
jgi:hypothetical protein